MKDKLATIIILAESIDPKITEHTLNKILIGQLHKNLEIFVSYTETVDYKSLIDKMPANIFWIKCQQGLDMLTLPTERASGDFIFYKTLNPTDWYPRHILQHLENLTSSKLEKKWAYSNVEFKQLNAPEPMNNLGWRVDFPLRENFVLDELVHTSNIKINWDACVVDAGNGQKAFLPGAVLEQLKTYHVIHPTEITMTMFMQGNPQQQEQKIVLGSPASDDVKESIKEVDGELIIVKELPTLVGNAEFKDRNKKILSQVDSENVQKIAIKRSMGMGDVLLVEPVTRALKNKYKNAKIDMFTTSYAGSNTIANMFPSVDSVNVTDANDLTKDTLYEKSGYDLKIDLDLAYESRPGMRYIDAYLEVCGFDEKIEEINGELIVTRGFDNEFLTPKIKYDEPRKIQEKYVAVELAGSGWGGKEWDIKNWELVIMQLIELGYRIVFTSKTRIIPYESFPLAKSWIVNEDNDFMTMLNYIKYCEFYIGADNGPMHIATAFGKPAFIISGAALTKYTTASSKVFSATKDDLGCLGCKHRMFFESSNGAITFVPNCTNENKYSCMKDLETSYVLQKFEEFTKNNQV